MKTEWIKLEELRQPGMRRILEAMQSIKEESPDLLPDASLASCELSKGRKEGGRISQ